MQLTIVRTCFAVDLVIGSQEGDVLSCRRRSLIRLMGRLIIRGGSRSCCLAKIACHGLAWTLWHHKPSVKLTRMSESQIIASHCACHAHHERAPPIAKVTSIAGPKRLNVM